MSDNKNTYHETLLHWIWDSLHFNFQSLETTDGRPVKIIDQGRLNTSDGPDFLNARLVIDDLQWYGDIEIHWKQRDWISHGHHINPRFNRVILHVIYHEPDGEPIRRQDGTRIPTVWLGEYIRPPLQELFDRFNNPDLLPCSGIIPHVPDKVISSQLEKAHREYFDEKVNVLLSFMDPDLPASLAWKQSVVLGLFDGLGISRNRESMVRLGKKLLIARHRFDHCADLVQSALEMAELDKDSGKMDFNWKQKGVRPPNRPEKRIPQAAELMWHVLELPELAWVGKNPSIIWNELLQRLAVEPGIGKRRGKLLYAIVFLPAFYLFGSLFNSEKHKNTAFNEWCEIKLPLPSSLLTPLVNADISPDLYRGKLGTVHQLKTYCHQRKCQYCEVLQHAINP